jgi:hypothetical protein
VKLCRCFGCLVAHYLIVTAVSSFVEMLLNPVAEHLAVAVLSSSVNSFYPIADHLVVAVSSCFC